MCPFMLPSSQISDKNSPICNQKFPVEWHKFRFSPAWCSPSFSRSNFWNICWLVNISYILKRWQMGQTLTLASNSKSCICYQIASFANVLLRQLDHNIQSKICELLISRRRWYVTADAENIKYEAYRFHFAIEWHHCVFAFDPDLLSKSSLIGIPIAVVPGRFASTRTAPRRRVALV